MLEFMDKLQTVSLEDVPDIELYMDQITTFMDTRLSGYKRTPADSILTKAMINNYTKNKMLPTPNKKKYSPGQLKLLIALYHLKPVLAIEDIKALLATQPDLDGFYASFLRLQETALENAKTTVADKLSLQEQSPGKASREDMALLAASLAVEAGIYKRLAEKMIDTYLK